METTNATANATQDLKKQDISKGADAPKMEIKPKQPLYSFPKDFSRKVSIRRKPKIATLPGIDPNDSKLKIGSSFKGASVNRGLTFEEEKKLLPSLIGIDDKSPNWENETKMYWCNISKDVPPDNGIELEVGLRYETEEDYNYDKNLPLNSRFSAFVNLKGTPINLADYILWRYCLVYNKVANDLAHAYDSPNIEFYLFNKDKEIQDKKILQTQKQNAFKLLMANMGDREWVDCMLRVFIASDKASNIYLKDLPTTGEDEKDILLEEYMTKFPDRFVALGNDKNLTLKSFIELAVTLGILNRVPNTTTITMDGTTIGNTTEEVVAFFNNPKNANTYATLKAQLRVVPN